jgi:tetratricopeptide (TPR) repeat protein
VVQDYTAAIKLSSDNVRLYNNRAYCLAKVGLYPEAVADYDRVCQLEPGNTHALHNRGIRYETLLCSLNMRDMARWRHIHGGVCVVPPGVEQ